MPGIKHLIECHCVLAIYRNASDVVFHKFPVYSKIDASGKIEEKLVKCNNCEAIHLVKEICKSEIKPGKDQSSVTVSKEDLSYSLSEKMVNFLNKVDADISIWENVIDIIEEKRWNEPIVIKRDVIDEESHVKILTILSEERFKVSSEVIKDLIVGKE